MQRHRLGGPAPVRRRDREDLYRRRSAFLQPGRWTALRSDRVTIRAAAGLCRSVQRCRRGDGRYLARTARRLAARSGAGSVTIGWRDDLLGFWFGLDPEQWWKADSRLDLDIRKRFLDLWEEQRENVPGHFLGDPRDALAAVILFDQFPRNMFRGHADQFSTDPLALAVAKGAVDKGLDDRLAPQERGFLYMPFQHSEAIADQRRSLALFTALGDAYQLRYAKMHHDVIDRFGRFPHRNPILGRKPRAAEIEAGDVVPW